MTLILSTNIKIFKGKNIVSSIFTLDATHYKNCPFITLPAAILSVKIADLG